MRCFLALLLSCLVCSAQTVSYWFQGWQRKPDAEQAQEYFMVPGANVYFTYATNRVIINATGGGTSTNYIPGTNIVFTHPSPFVYQINMSGGSPMPPGAAVWWTDGTNVWWTNTIPGQVYIGNGTGPHINLYNDGRGNFESNLTTKAKLSSQTLEVSSNAVFGGTLYGNGAGLTNVPTVGLTTNFTVFLSNGDTNQLFFTNGLLVAMSIGTPVFSGFYLLDDAGDNILDDNGNKIIVNP